MPVPKELLRYCIHDADCRWRYTDGQGQRERCDCGLDAVLASLADDDDASWEPIPYYESLIAIIGLLQLVVEDTSKQKNLDGTKFWLADFDAGHLAGAITIIESVIDPEYPGLKKYHRDEGNRRLLEAIHAHPLK